MYVQKQKVEPHHQTFKFFLLFFTQKEDREGKEGPGQVLDSGLLANGFGWGLKREAAVSINSLCSSS